MSEAMNQVLFGDVRQTLPRLPARLFHCAMTSPPYWNLRSYLKPDDENKVHEIGSEKTPDEFVATMVGVFREVRRVLRDDGVLWVNLGDSYAAGTTTDRNPSGNHGGNGYGKHGYWTNPNITKRVDDPALNTGSQLLMPHRVAMAMQADGWILRSTIIWAKKSPMPESIAGWRWVKCRVKSAALDHGKRNGYEGSVSVGGQSHSEKQSGTGAPFLPRCEWSACPGCDKCRDNGGMVLRRGKWRPTTAHEYVFMFSKGERYFCDGDAVQEIAVGGTPGNKTHRGATEYHNGDDKHRTKVGLVNMVASERRNPRSVWSLSSEPYKGAHFATFPTELARRCIAASTSTAGCCASCGSPFAPVVQSERVPTRPGDDSKVNAFRNSGRYQDHVAEADNSAIIGNRDPQRHVAVSRVTGYLPTCRCEAAPSVPCRVLDPFGGSGTVGQVAHHLGCDYVLCELNREYLPLIEARITTLPRWKVKRHGKAPAKPNPSQRSLFA